MRARLLKPSSVVLLGLAVVSGVVNAQTRINDKDLAALMRNLRDDAKAFRSPFESALKRSTIRKTSQEKDAKNLADLFAKQTEALLNNFKQTKGGDANLSGVQSSAQRLSGIVSNYQLGPQVTSKWARIQDELGRVLTAYNMTPVTSTGSGLAVTGPREVSGVSCLAGVGRERADRLVQECTQVSPATHPPCNAENSCALIIDEIKRGCALLDARDRPAFCAEYR